MPDIPTMRMGKELLEALTYLPTYNDSIRQLSASERLIALNNIYNIYYPSSMAVEIYSKLYLAFVRSTQKKQSILATRQLYENRKAIIGQQYQGLIGGADSFTIIGKSGTGKSSSIEKAISLICEDKNASPSLIPFAVIQTPSDCSVKGLLLEILRKVDEYLNTKYYQNALRSRATTDMLIGSVSQVCLNHIGVLILDEVQNVVTSKNGKGLIGNMIQLINNSGISICFVGTPECNPFFESAFQLARRTVGLYYSSLSYDDYFYKLCEVVFSYQYVQHHSAITSNIVEWLYSHSGGITAVLIGLIHDAQEIAIIEGTEKLNIEALNTAYQRRMRMLHGFTADTPINAPTTAKKAIHTINVQSSVSSVADTYILSLITEAKTKSLNALEYVKCYIPIEEIVI